MATRFFNARVLRKSKLESGELWVKEGVVVSPQKEVDAHVDVQGRILAPGYIDLQLNGGFGIDFLQQPERIGEVASTLPACGVVGFLPTLISSDKEDYRRILPALRPAGKKKGEAENLGIHLEGPFINPHFRGAHPLNAIIPFDPSQTLEDYYGDLEGVVLVTLAPEVFGALKAIDRLHQKNILISLGHTGGSYEEVRQAFDKGVLLATHLFNGMKPFTARDPGVVGMALVERGFLYSLILDGHHLHPDTVRLAWKCNQGGLFLVSDAMSGMGQGEGRYKLGAVQVEVKESKAVLLYTSTLAGSVLTMDQAVRNLKKITECSLEEALEAASWKPACVLGIAKSRGHLEEGAVADFIVVDEKLNLLATYIAGECCFESPQVF